MTLPRSRNKTYVEGMPVAPGDLNDLQDQIVGRKHGTKTLILSVSAPAIGIFNTQPATLSGGAGSPTATWMRQIDGLTVGDRITAMRARVKDNASGPTRLRVGLSTGTNGAPADIATSPLSSGSGASQTLTALSAADVVSGLSYHASVFIDGGGSGSSSVFQVEVDIERL